MTNLETNSISFHLVRRKGYRGIKIAVYNTLEVKVTASKYVPEAVIKAYVFSHSAWIRSKLDFYLRKGPVKKSVPLSSAEYLNLKNKTIQLITPKLTHYRNLLQVNYKSVTVRNQKTRWGSCSRQGRLNFNCRLCLLPDELIDYVVVHELCHLKELNHSKRFWAHVASILPNHKLLRSQIHKQGISLS